MTCRRCGDVLYWDEVDFGICDTCADILAIQYQERKDWEYWHEERASQSQIEEPMGDEVSQHGDGLHDTNNRETE